MIVEYGFKFEELVKFYLHYNAATMEGSKCIKFENGLQSEIKQGIGYQEIHIIPNLMNKCRIYDEDYKARSLHYKSVSERKGESI